MSNTTKLKTRFSTEYNLDPETIKTKQLPPRLIAATVILESPFLDIELPSGSFTGEHSLTPYLLIPPHFNLIDGSETPLINSAALRSRAFPLWLAVLGRPGNEVNTLKAFLNDINLYWQEKGRIYLPEAGKIEFIFPVTLHGIRAQHSIEDSPIEVPYPITLFKPVVEISQ